MGNPAAQPENCLMIGLEGDNRLQARPRRNYLCESF